jgi:arylsulfatase A-like enzyme
VNRSGTLASGLALGLLAGAADAIAIILENPRSFENVSIAGFLGAAIALGGVLGLAAGAVAAALRLPPGAVLVPGIALVLFGMAGVRVHVRWFFGERLLGGESLLANAALAAGSAGTAWILWKMLGRGLSRRSTGRAPTVAGVVLCTAGALVALATRPAPSRPGGGPVPSVAARARDVLLVTLDTTRADHLSCYGYPRGTTPAIDRLARTGSQWVGAYAPVPLTAPSHASMLTGLPPRKHGVLNNGQPLRVSTFVQSELASRGWHCAAFVSGIPLKRASGLARGFHTYDDVFSPLETVHPMLTSLAAVRIANRVFPFDLVERRAEDTCAAAIEWLRSTDSPRFLWVHLFDPHTPYDAPDVLRRRFAVESAAWTAMDRPVVEWPIAHYDAELRETDRWLEDLLRAFRDATGGEGEVILTADHGEGLEQHGELAHGTQLHEEDLLVPFVTSHSLSGRQGPEIVPTVFDVREVASVVPMCALTSKLSPVPHTVVKPWTILCETFAPEGRKDQSAAIEGTEYARPQRKLLHDWETGQRVGFDLDRDPGERHPLEPLAAEWSPLIRSLPEERLARSPRPEPDPETVRRLRALGYVH